MLNVNETVLWEKVKMDINTRAQMISLKLKGMGI